jgi:preprotein translocase subunit SecD
MMTTIGNILRSADPLEREAMWTPQQRRAIEQRVLSSAHTTGAARQPRRRAMVTAGCAVALVALALFAPKFSSSALQAAVRFEMRLAETKPAPGLQAVSLPPAAETIYLHPEAIVSNADVASAMAVAGTGSLFSVQITFNSGGAEKIQRATANHVGRPVAILIDGKVVAAPVVRSPIRNEAQLTGELTRAEAERIAGGMIGR